MFPSWLEGMVQTTIDVEEGYGFWEEATVVTSEPFIKISQHTICKHNARCSLPHSLMCSLAPSHARSCIDSLTPSLVLSIVRSCTHPLQLPVYLRQAAEGLPAVEKLQFVVPADGGRGAGVGAGEIKKRLLSRCEQLHVRVAGRNSAVTPITRSP